MIRLGEKSRSHTTTPAFLFLPASPQPESNAASNLEVSTVMQTDKNSGETLQFWLGVRKGIRKVQRKWGNPWEVREFSPFSPFSYATDSKITQSNGGSSDGGYQQITGAKTLKKMIELRTQVGGCNTYTVCFFLSSFYPLTNWHQSQNNWGSRKFLTRDLKKGSPREPESSRRIMESKNKPNKFYMNSWAQSSHLNMCGSYPNQHTKDTDN